MTKKKLIQAARCALPSVHLVIAELVIIFFIGHWNVVIGHYLLRIGGFTCPRQI